MNSGLRGCFLLLIGIAFTSNLPAQTSGLGTWNLINVRYNATKRFSLFGEAQLRSLRFYDHFHYYEYKGCFNYKANDALTVSLGGGSYQTYKEGGNFQRPKNNDEFRLWPQLLIQQTIGKFRLEQRYRVEMRWTSNGYRNRFRYRVGLSYPFGTDKKGYQPLLLTVNNELFFTDKEPYFERNRLQGTLNYRLHPQFSLQVGYLHQFDYKINDETGRDFLVLGCYFEFTRQPKTDTDNP